MFCLSDWEETRAASLHKLHMRQHSSENSTYQAQLCSQRPLCSLCRNPSELQLAAPILPRSEQLLKPREGQLCRRPKTGATNLALPQTLLASFWALGPQVLPAFLHLYSPSFPIPISVQYHLCLSSLLSTRESSLRRGFSRPYSCGRGCGRIPTGLLRSGKEAGALQKGTWPAT